MFLDFLQRGGFTEALYVLIFAVFGPPVVIGVGNLPDVILGKFPVGAVPHKADFPGIDEKDLAGSFSVAVADALAGDKPQTGGDAGIVE